MANNHGAIDRTFGAIPKVYIPVILIITIGEKK
jgi:hypothetical protein